MTASNESVNVRSVSTSLVASVPSTSVIDTVSVIDPPVTTGSFANFTASSGD